jgi:hypothetical protein
MAAWTPDTRRYLLRRFPFSVVYRIEDSGVCIVAVALVHSSRFIEILNRSWGSYRKNGEVSLEEVRRRHGPARKAKRRRKAR